MAAPHTALQGTLAYGYIAVYGLTQTGVTGMISLTQGYNFGSVYQISPYGIQHVSVGQSIFFSGSKIEARLASPQNDFAIIQESAIIITENPLA